MLGQGTERSYGVGEVVLEFEVDGGGVGVFDVEMNTHAVIGGFVEFESGREKLSQNPFKPDKARLFLKFVGEIGRHYYHRLQYHPVLDHLVLFEHSLDLSKLPYIQRHLQSNFICVISHRPFQLHTERIFVVESACHGVRKRC